MQMTDGAHIAEVQADVHIGDGQRDRQAADPAVVFVPCPAAGIRLQADIGLLLA